MIAQFMSSNLDNIFRGKLEHGKLLNGAALLWNWKIVFCHFNLWNLIYLRLRMLAGGIFFVTIVKRNVYRNNNIEMYSYDTGGSSFLCRTIFGTTEVQFRKLLQPGCCDSLRFGFLHCQVMPKSTEAKKRNLPGFIFLLSCLRILS